MIIRFLPPLLALMQCALILLRLTAIDWSWWIILGPLLFVATAVVIALVLLVIVSIGVGIQMGLHERYWKEQE